MPDQRYSLWYKRLRMALELTRHDVVLIMRLGGMTISSSRADGWARAHDRSDDRIAVMSELEFDAFTTGLVAWSRATPSDGRGS